LERRYANYQYLTLTTREPRNVDPTVADYIGKLYLQEFIASGAFEGVTGHPLKPETTHVFLCGSPVMIGAPDRLSGNGHVFPQPTGMVEILIGRGFEIDRPKHPGNLHFEKYW
jgi:ferredoxin--NADP+ reductase